MRREIVEQDVEGFGTVHAKELTVAELALLIKRAEFSDTPILDNIFSPYSVTTAAINKSLGLDLRDLVVSDLHIDSSKCADDCNRCNKAEWKTTCPIKDLELDRQKDKALPEFSGEALRYCASCNQCVDVCKHGVFELVYKEYLPSALISLVDMFKEVNPTFIAGEDYQEKKMRENLRAVAFMEKAEKEKMKKSK